MEEYNNDKEKLYNFLLDKNNQQKFYRLAYSYVNNKEAALDVCQEAVANALKSFAKLREIAYLKTWFYRILINGAVSYIRKDSKYVLTEDFTSYENSDNYNDGGVDILSLYEAIKALPHQQRILIQLRYFEDMKFSDIASVLDTPESTIKTRLKAAITKLSVVLKEDSIWKTN